MASSRGEEELPTGLRHGDHAHRYSRGIPSWRRSHLSGLRHGHLAHRYLSGIPAWQSVLLIVLRHGAHFHNHLRAIPAWRRSHLSGLWHCDPAHRYLSGILAWRRGTSDRSSARRPCPQVFQRHPVVAKESSIGSSARPPCPQVPQWHPRVAKCSSDRPSARRPCPQVPQWHPRVAKESSIGSSARRAPRHLRGWFCAMNTDLETSVSGKGSSYGSEHRERISSPCNSGFNGKFCLRYRLHFIIFASECSEYIRGTRKRQEHLRANRRRTGNAIREGSGLCYRQN